jgi:sporulation protein YlmC with PRC-barrel domain
MPEQTEMMEWRGCEVVDQDGDKVGKLDEIYIDRETGRPEWAIVNTGFFGRKSSFVPLKDALRDGDMIRVPYQAEQIKDAPSVEPDGEISREEEQQVYSHYGLDYSQAQSGSGLPEGTSTAAAAGNGSADAGPGEPNAAGTADAGPGEPNAAGTAGTTEADGDATADTGRAGGGDPSAGTGEASDRADTTAGERSPSLRLQRMFREDVRIAGDSGEVVERRTVEEERLTGDENEER